MKPEQANDALKNDAGDDKSKLDKKQTLLIKGDDSKPMSLSDLRNLAR